VLLFFESITKIPEVLKALFKRIMWW